MLSSVLDRFADHLSSRPYCSDHLSGGLLVRPRAGALKKKYIQLNQIRSAYLAFDVDREGAAFAYQDANLPPPTITTINKENGHAHLLYELETPISRGVQSRFRPIYYYQAIYRGFKRKLGADNGYSGLITKNPFSSSWGRTLFDIPYSLDELDEYLSKKDKRLDIQNSKNHISYNESRNCDIFDYVRKLAYIEARETNNADSLYRFVLSCCDQQNQIFLEQLGISEINAIAKSITKFCWLNRHKLGLSEKKRGQIEKAIMHFRELGIQVEDSVIARHAKLSLDSVRRYFGKKI